MATKISRLGGSLDKAYARGLDRMTDDEKPRILTEVKDEKMARYLTKMSVLAEAYDLDFLNDWVDGYCLFMKSHKRRQETAMVQIHQAKRLNDLSDSDKNRGVKSELEELLGVEIE